MNFQDFCGWVDSPDDVKRAMESLPMPVFGDHSDAIRGTGVGKTVLLYKYVEKLIGNFNVRRQAIGDCFVEKTKVLLGDGSVKNIEHVTVGDQVVTHLGNTKTVTDTIRKDYIGHLVEIRSVDNTTPVVCTDDHEFVVVKRGRRGWKEAKHIESGDIVFYNGQPTQVSSRIRYDKQDTKVYCLEVENDHSFIANGFAVHNCVSFGYAAGVDALKATEIVIAGDFEQWEAETSTEDIYGGSRVQIGGGRLGNSDGSMGAWAAKYVNTYGTLVRKNFGSIDLTTYSGQRAKQWGGPRGGTPLDLLPIAKEHTVLTVSQINSVEECRDAVANGYPVTICSNQGFSDRRDSEGFAAPQGSWAHCMCIIAVDDVGIDTRNGRKGFLVQNSWGPWNGGPKRLDQPDGSFWVDYDVMYSRILRSGDNWALSDFNGWRPKKLNLRLF